MNWRHTHYPTLGLLLAISGCIFGPRASNYAPASRAAGLTAAITLHGSVSSDRTMLSGEVLSVRRDAITILSADGMITVYLSAIEEARFVEDTTIKVDKGTISFERLERLRLQSRFPQGMTSEVEARLLEKHGWNEILVVR